MLQKETYILELNNILLKKKSKQQLIINSETEKHYSPDELDLYWQVINSCLKEFNANNFKNLNFKINLVGFTSFLKALQEEAFLTVGTILFEDEKQQPLVNLSLEEYSYIKTNYDNEVDFFKALLSSTNIVHSWFTTKDGFIIDTTIINQLNNYNTDELDLLILPISFLSKNNIKYIPYDIVDYKSYLDLDNDILEEFNKSKKILL